MTAPTTDLFAMAADLFDAEFIPPAVPGWEAQPKQQQAWDLAGEVFELLYGGAAGGGKSFFLAAYLVFFCLTHPRAHVGLVRQTLPLLKQTHAIDTLPIFTAGLAVHNRVENTWTFPNGSVLRFVHLQHDGDEQKYKSAQFDVLGFDEVTELLETQYTYMLTRMRSKMGYRTHVICTANPEGTGFQWVKRRWVKPKLSDLGEGDEMPVPMQAWAPPVPGDLGRRLPLRAFIPATILDNKKLLDSQPDYVDKIRLLPDQRRVKALLEGDWDAMDQVPGALWSMDDIGKDRVGRHPSLFRCAVAIDPAGTDGPYSDETGIIAAGVDVKGHSYVLADRSGKYSVDAWARTALQLYIDVNANFIVLEKTAGAGSDALLKNLQVEARAMMQEGVLSHMPMVKTVNASPKSGGKYTRAEPVAVLYKKHVVHHVGEFEDLEEQMTTWLPKSGYSPDRVDALVWCMYGLYEAEPGRGVVINW